MVEQQSGTSHSLGIRTALRLEALTLGWMMVEAALSIGAGLAARSLLLFAFGADSVIELISACVLFNQLLHELRAAPELAASVQARKRRASRIAGYLLYLLSLYVVTDAVYGLIQGRHASTSWIGMGVAGIAAVGMPLLARAKLRVADQISNAALRADAMEAICCGYLSWALLIGLGANALFHWWWLDAAAAIAIVPLLLKGAREAIAGECCGGHCS